MKQNQTTTQWQLEEATRKSALDSFLTDKSVGGYLSWLDHFRTFPYEVDQARTDIRPQICL